MLVQIHNIGHSINSGRPKDRADKPSNPSPPSTGYCARTVQTPSERARPATLPNMSPKLDEMLDISKITEKEPLTFYRDLFTDL